MSEQRAWTHETETGKHAARRATATAAKEVPHIGCIDLGRRCRHRWHLVPALCGKTVKCRALRRIGHSLYGWFRSSIMTADGLPPLIYPADKHICRSAARGGRWLDLI